MSDLFFLNELDKITEDKPQNTYKTDVGHSASVNLFIKALQKTIEKINDGIETLSKVKKPRATAIERDHEDSKLLVEFIHHLDLASKILDEFQKGTSILSDNAVEIEQLFTFLNASFTNARLKVGLFSVMMDLKYANEAIEIIESTLKLFYNMKETIESKQ